MPRPKRILSGDEYITKTEKMIGLPKKYPNLSKTEKMVYLPRSYYNNHEKIDDGFLNYIPLDYVNIVVELNLRPDTAFGYPTWGSVFGGFEFIASNNGSTNPFLFNGAGSNQIDCFSSYNVITNAFDGYIDSFLPFIGGFYSILEGYNTEYKDKDRFCNSFIQSPIIKYIFLQNNNQDRTKIQLFNNNRAKIVYQDYIIL